MVRGCQPKRTCFGVSHRWCGDPYPQWRLSSLQCLESMDRIGLDTDRSSAERRRAGGTEAGAAATTRCVTNECALRAPATRWRGSMTRERPPLAASGEHISG